MLAISFGSVLWLFFGFLVSVLVLLYLPRVALRSVLRLRERKISEQVALFRRIGPGYVGWDIVKYRTPRETGIDAE
jgi:hypothetical protein